MSRPPTPPQSADGDTSKTTAPAAFELESILNALRLHERLSAMEKEFKDVRAKEYSEQSLGAPDSRSIWLYGAGFVATGLTCGYFAGWSYSPVVGTLLPLLFGLLGGAGGLHIATGDLKTRRTALLGAALLGFAVAALLGAHLGVSARTGKPLLEFLPRLSKDSATDQVQPAAKDVETELDFALFKQRLRVLDIPEDEQKALLRSVESLLAASRDREEIKRAFSPYAGALREAAIALRALAKLNKDVTLSGDLENHALGLERFAGQLDWWTATDPDNISRADVMTLLAGSAKDVRNIVGDVSTRLAPNAADALRKLAETEKVGARARDAAERALKTGPERLSDLLLQTERANQYKTEQVAIDSKSRADRGPASLLPE